MRSAALTDHPTQPSERRVREEQRDQIDWLLAQGMPLNTTEASGQILAGLLLSTPESVEEDIAKQYGLEVVRRFTVESPDKRIVVFRVPDTRAVTDVLVALKADHRVISAQIKAIYKSPQQPPPTPEISELKQEPPAKGQAKHASRPGQKSTPASGEARPGERFNTAQGASARPSPPIKMSSQEGSLAARNHAALRWPTADEPFVNVGVTNK